MKKKLVSTFLASALLVSTLAGCGFTGGDSGSNTPVSSGDPGTATTTRDTLTYYDSNEIRTLVQCCLLYTSRCV